MFAKTLSHPLEQSRRRHRMPDTNHLHTEERLLRIASEGKPAIDRRLRELDHEWSAGRVAKVIAAAGILVGLVAAVLISLWWLVLPVVFGLLLLQHVVSRDCWLTRALTALGLRSGIAIEHERCALKALRGDFRNLPIVYDRTDEDALARLADEGGIPEETPPLHEENRAAVKDVLQRVSAPR
jgi:hypothetical protein